VTYSPPIGWQAPGKLVKNRNINEINELRSGILDLRAKNTRKYDDSPKCEPAAVQPKPGPQQEANAVPPESDDINVVSALPTVPADSFDSRWHGFQ
jgi:hypothetical protein